jgi:GWxTD domain-containing protein
MKRIIPLCLFLLFLSVLGAQDLNIAIDMNRFLSGDGNTTFEINYQITYKNLSFEWQDSLGFVASLSVDYQLKKSGKGVQDNFTNKIIVRNQASTQSSKYFTDKISFTLTKPGYNYVMKIKDLNNNLESDWESNCDLFVAGSIISDLEFSSSVTRDTTSYMPKFHRNDFLYDINVSHVFSNLSQDSLAVYYELQNYEFASDGQCDVDVKIFIKKKDLIISEYSDFVKVGTETHNKVSWIDITDFEVGYYDLILEVYDQNSGLIEVNQDFFSLKQPKLFTQRMFVEISDELELIGYFIEKSKHKSWKTLTDDGRNNFVSRFWTTSDPDPSTDNNEFFDLIKKRVQYCNQEFSHFKKGWSSDRGRVYLRHGKPDDVINEETGLNTKYAQKDFQIWKYRSQGNMTYIFLDFQTSGNYRIIYADGDDMEGTQVGWESYLGKDFDPGLLQ